ncbi:cryptochrome/photolyase family protein [Roseinatronobacter alkalisoli]|uniref:Deoxyribodipyrimidine photo-lyase n=1 Tax=Roseinatronobacter alkalisoli TaxID=3028235 RepID=A0ABT5TBX5_9RHOB|nr:deoxyribodipyrimidine photo-lyase [Roseinatronobacter sp. HJB301]MDD7972623.1 deoxyribodipyrimidine photo-lyase [Roseinatronobacter sp. HJB301]
MTQLSPVIWWVRRDLRLADNPVLHAAASSDRPVIALFICDPLVEGLGAAPKWRLGLGVARFARCLDDMGSKLILRRGDALTVLQQLIAQIGATAVWWGRQYDPDQVARDKKVKAALRDSGVDAQSFSGHLLFEPWQVQTGQGTFYQVYSPFWRAVKDLDVAPHLPAPECLRAPAQWPDSDSLADWGLGRAMNRGADVVHPHLHIGEDAARTRLAYFIDRNVADYQDQREFLDQDACSGLSENLTYGEISPGALWRAGQHALDAGKAGAAHFLKEIVWREFAYHLIFHTPHIVSRNWRDGWDSFPWSNDGTGVLRWKQGRTGIDVIDAAMRELYVTGRMHNRARMLVASYLTKHMLTHWRVGQDWFAQCLVDWDPAANAMGWQWVAGSGPDAAPYFRIFNPDTQARKFDPEGRYRRKWLAEISASAPETAQAFFRACPRSWQLSPQMARPNPLVDLAEGRKIALQAYDIKNKT